MSVFTIPPSVEARLNDCPYPLLFATVSGAHLYGFESADSDWDLRGAFIAPTREAVSLRPGRETYELMDKEAVQRPAITTRGPKLDRSSNRAQ